MSHSLKDATISSSVKEYGWTGVGRCSLPDGIRYALMPRAAGYLPNSRRDAAAL